MKTPLQVIKAIYRRLYYYCCPDKIYLNNKFRQVFGRNIDWKNPKTFNEKLQWLKIYDRNPLYTQLVDKYEVRKYIAEKIGEEYLIPCLGVWDKFDDIDFAALPNQFVLKCTHDSHSVIICKDKSSFDFDEARKSISEHLRRNFYYNAREWPYKNVKPRIIAEKYMTESGTELADFKVHCFNGTPRFILECKDRFQERGMSETFFSSDWVRMDLKRPEVNTSEEICDKPEELDEMLRISEVLAKDFPFARTDFYSANGKVYFGEITFYPSSGFVGFDPSSYDALFGDWMRLPWGGVHVPEERLSSEYKIGRHG